MAHEPSLQVATPMHRYRETNYVPLLSVYAVASMNAEQPPAMSFEDPA
jgi:hypothetical protein